MRVFLIICGILLLLIAGALVWGHLVITKDYQESKPYVTYTRLMYAASRCDLYKNEFGVWPNSLAQLRAFRPEFNDWAKDAWGPNGNNWGRDFLLVPYDQSVGYGRLISYGRDGKQGGTGADRDLIIRFPREANTNWNEQMGKGLKQPRFNP